MRIRVRRRITIEELWKIINEYEYSFGTPDRLRRELLVSQDEKLKGKLDEWINALNALREYEEDGEENFIKEEEVDPAVVRRLLTDNMVKLLKEIENGVASISELARKVRRSVPNVYSDLQFLYRNGFLGFQKRGKHVVPYLLLEEVIIDFR
ncbi:MAG: hypothetical protein DRJ38_01520 [Thermoprotei archaeon]|nr:MAG: hypothetical protein DRJ38_01520 [Thermoprotei archaeon]